MKYPENTPTHGKRYKMNFTDGVTTVQTTGEAKNLSGMWFINDIMLYDGAEFFDAPPADGTHIDYRLKNGSCGRGWVVDGSIYAVMGSRGTPICVVCSVDGIEEWSEV